MKYQVSILIVALLAASTDAFAYIDPVGATAFIQSVVSIIVAVAFYLKKPAELIKLLKEFISKVKK